MSKNSTDRLVYMANQIAANLQREPDPVAATAQHIQLYWDPRMKAMIAAQGSEGLSATASEAIAKLGR
jgi:formate dehydrogenase subunit delta